jgi:hypothetical protein
MDLNWIKYLWGIISKIHPETKTLIIVLLFGWVLYSQITDETGRIMTERFE